MGEEYRERDRDSFPTLSTAEEPEKTSDADQIDWEEARLRPRISYWYLQVAVVVFYSLYVFTAIRVCVVPIFGSYTHKYTIAVTVPLGSLVVMSLINYIRAYVTSPGYIGRVQRSEKSNSKSLLANTEKLDGTRHNYCMICQIYKPPRCHHCRRCNRCVLRMDHHCLWINNCVGLHNHKYFFLFVFYAWVAFVAIFLLYVARWLNYLTALHEPSLAIWEYPVLIAATIFDVGHILTVGWMLVFQIFLISHGRTNVEHACCKGDAEGCNFDQGSYFANWRSIFGDRVIDWWLPTAPPYQGGRKEAEQLEYQIMKDYEY